MELERLSIFTPYKKITAYDKVQWQSPRDIYIKAKTIVPWIYYNDPEDYSNPTIENPPIGYTFKPEPPYGDYTKAYITLYPNSNRRWVALSGSPKRSATILQYNRYLMQIHMSKNSLGDIPTDYEVDHINNICIDDRIENLQCISSDENRQKFLAQKGEVHAVLVCPVCKTKFLRVPVGTQCNPYRRDRVCCCTKECLNRMQTIRDVVPFEKTSRWINENQILYIVRLFLNDKYVIPVTELISYWPNRTMLSKEWMLTDDNNNLIDFKEIRFSSTEKKIDFLTDCIHKEMGLREIGRAMNLPHSLIRNLIQRYGLLEPYEAYQKKKALRLKGYLEKKMLYSEIATVENIRPQGVYFLIESLKKYM